MSLLLLALVLGCCLGMALVSPSYRVTQQGDGRQFEEMVLDGLKVSGAITADSQSNSIDLGNRRTLDLFLDCTARSGTNPTMDITVQTSHDDSDWVTLGTFTQLTAAASERKTMAGARRYLRYDYNIGGTNTPSFTFSIVGSAH